MTLYWPSELRVFKYLFIVVFFIFLELEMSRVSCLLFCSTHCSQLHPLAIKSHCCQFCLCVLQLKGKPGTIKKKKKNKNKLL